MIGIHERAWSREGNQHRCIRPWTIPLGDLICANSLVSTTIYMKLSYLSRSTLKEKYGWLASDWPISSCQLIGCMVFIPTVWKELCGAGAYSVDQRDPGGTGLDGKVGDMAWSNMWAPCWWDHRRNAEREERAEDKEVRWNQSQICPFPKVVAGWPSAGETRGSSFSLFVLYPFTQMAPEVIFICIMG